jgi:hypothetical protein
MTAAFDAALASGAPRIGIFFRLGIVMDDGQPFRMWLGVGDCRAGIDAEDEGEGGAGAIYRGMGEMLNVPAFQQLINGTAERVSFTLSGVPPRAIELAAEESDEVKGAPLNVGLGAFDADWQLVAPPVWLKRFVVDFLSVQMQQSGMDEAVHTISLSARSIFTGRRRPGLSFFTDDDQQARSPGDRFCEHVRRYSNETKSCPRGG